MKVLFAISNEEISESIVKKYQAEYKQIISSKNVYYFNAILKEIQKDKTYDRIVISEDLEAFTHSQYDQIDKFIFEKLDSISDEASNGRGKDIPIILICTDRRMKSEQILVKLFGIGIYNALIGADRSVEEVCRLLYRPRTKKEAKDYYKIDSDEVNYAPESENDVSEVEIQNILAHYKKLGKDEKQFVESFDNIAEQYNDKQLRVIAKILPLNVRAVLEEKSPKYQKVMSFSNTISDDLRRQGKPEGPTSKLLQSDDDKQILSKPVVIPSGIKEARKLSTVKRQVDLPPLQKQFEPVEEDIHIIPPEEQHPITSSMASQRIETHSNYVQPVQPIQQVQPVEQPPQFSEEGEIQRGEPVIPTVPQNMGQANPIEPVSPVEQVAPVQEEQMDKPKRGRGRPRKNPVPTEQTDKPKRGRGRPRKNPVPVQPIETVEQVNPVNPVEPVIPQEKVVQPIQPIQPIEPTQPVQPEFERPVIEPLENVGSIIEPLQPPSRPEPPVQEVNPLEQYRPKPVEPIRHTRAVDESRPSRNEYVNTIDISSLLTPEKKIVSFLGTSKNGTSFIVNNLAELASSMGIKTAILDTTTNRNSYYIYTKNEESLREVALNSFDSLINKQPQGIKANKNLTVFTSLPDDDEKVEMVDEILETLVKNYSLILIDTDFNTPIGYFKQSQELYLVQSLDILTIQPLTAFLRKLKSKNVLEERKIRIIINKAVKVKGIQERTIIGGMAYYTDPAMSYMTELFDRNTVKYITIPFEDDTYIRYLENIINCEISLKGYSKVFMQSLKELANMVYPLVPGGNQQNNYNPPSAFGPGNRGGNFSPNMNSTLNQMKNNY